MNTSPADRLQGPDAAGAREKAQQAKLKKTCQQFEAVLVGRLLQDMRKSTMPTGLFGKGVDDDIYGSFMDQAVADKVASRGGFGVAAMMERNLAERAVDLATPEARAAAGSQPLPLHPAAAVRGPGQLHPLRASESEPVSLHVPAGPLAAPAQAPGGGGPVPARRALPQSTAAPASPWTGGRDTRARAYAGQVAAARAAFGSLAAQIESFPDQAPREAASAPRLNGGAGRAATAAAPPAAARAATVPVPHVPASRDSAPPAPGRAGAARVTDPALDPMIRRAASESGVEPGLLRAVVLTESAGRSRAVSPKGAAGLMQLMPDTAKAMGVKDVFDPWENVRGGARYLAQLLERFGGSVTHALAAYNAGPTAVEKHGGVPPYPETRRYVRRVLGQMGRS